MTKYSDSGIFKIKKKGYVKLVFLSSFYEVHYFLLYIYEHLIVGSLLLLETNLQKAEQCIYIYIVSSLHFMVL
jgi:hypothetical protein